LHHHQSSVEGDLLLEDHHTASFDWPWGISLQVTPAPEACWRGEGKVGRLGRWRRFRPGRWCQSKHSDAFRWSKPCVFVVSGAGGMGGV